MCLAINYNGVFDTIRHGAPLPKGCAQLSRVLPRAVRFCPCWANIFHCINPLPRVSLRSALGLALIGLSAR